MFCVVDTVQVILFQISLLLWFQFKSVTSTSNKSCVLLVHLRYIMEHAVVFESHKLQNKIPCNVRLHLLLCWSFSVYDSHKLFEHTNTFPLYLCHFAFISRTHLLHFLTLSCVVSKYLSSHISLNQIKSFMQNPKVQTNMTVVNRIKTTNGSIYYMQNNNKPQKLKDIYLKPHIRCRLGDWKFVAWNEPATLQMKAVSCENCSRCFNFFGFVFINFVSIFRRIRKHVQGEFGFKVKWKDLCNPKGMNLTRAEKRVNRFRSKTKKAHSMYINNK